MNVAADSQHFYVLANKKDKKIGFFLFIIDFDGPNEPYKYLINWYNKTPIQQVDLYFLVEKNYDSDLRKDAFVSRPDQEGDETQANDDRPKLDRQNVGKFADNNLRLKLDNQRKSIVHH